MGVALIHPQVRHRECGFHRTVPESKRLGVLCMRVTIVWQIYGGRLVRSEGLDELLGQNGVDKSQHHRAVQVLMRH